MQASSDPPPPRVLVRALPPGASTGPEVLLRHGESPSAAAERAADEPGMEVGRPRSVGYGVHGGLDTYVVEFEVRPRTATGLGATERFATDLVATESEPTEVDPTAVPHRRLGAYAVVLDDDRLLLTQLARDTPAPGAWTLPGGGIDPGESPLDAVVREVREETAHDLVAPRLLDVDSMRFTGRSPHGRLEDFHGLSVIYVATVRVVREPEVLDVDGSTSAARWVPLRQVPQLTMSARSRQRLTRAVTLAGVTGSWG